MTSKSKLATSWICLLLAGTLVCSGTLLAQTAEKPKRNLLFIGQSMGLIPGDATPCSKPEKLTTTANGR